MFYNQKNKNALYDTIEKMERGWTAVYLTYLWPQGLKCQKKNPMIFNK